MLIQNSGFDCLPYAQKSSRHNGEQTILAHVEGMYCVDDDKYTSMPENQ